MCVPKKSGGIRIIVNYQKLNKVTEILQIAISRVDEVLDTLGGGSVFSVFDLFSGFTQLTIHPDTIPLTAFCTPNGLYEWLRMPQGASGAPAWFVSVMRLVTAGLDNIRMYLDDAIGSDDCPIHHVTTLTAYFARLHQLKLSPDESRIGAARVDFLGHIISKDGVRPNDDGVAALTRLLMPTDIKQLRSLLGGLSYYRKFLPSMARLIRPITALLKKGAAFDFTSIIEDTVRALLAKLAAPPILVFPDWDAVIDTTRPFRLHCDASTAGLGATLEQEPPDGSVRPIVYISRATLDNEQNWTAMELEDGCVVWGIRRLRRYLFGVYFLVFTDHQCLQQICKIGETKPRIQRWMEFLSAYNFRFSYRRGQDHANADFLFPLALPSHCRGHIWRIRPNGLRRSWCLSHPCVRIYHPCLPRPWRRLGWANPSALPCPRRDLGWADPSTGYSGLGWATPYTRRLSHSPCSDAAYAHDSPPSSIFRDPPYDTLRNIRY